MLAPFSLSMTDLFLQSDLFSSLTYRFIVYVNTSYVLLQTGSNARWVCIWKLTDLTVDVETVEIVICYMYT